MSAPRGIAPCPRCGRTVTTTHSRYIGHSSDGGQNDPCRMSGQRVPITGVTPFDMVNRAYLVADLADQVQDRDPLVVWDYLTALPPAEVQRLLVVALAGLRTDQSLDQLFSWVTELPATKYAAAQKEATA